MAHVLVLSLVFPPDGVSTAVIVGELAADLKRDGFEVTVVTTVPHYNTDAEAEARQPRSKVWGRLLYASEYHGIRVLHSAIPRKTASVGARLFAWLQFHVLSLAAALALVRRVDVILTPSPPLTAGICAWLLGLWYRAPFVYNAQELYPDVAVSLGALKNRRIISLLYRIERFVYAKARFVTVIAPGMRRRVIEKSVPAAKVRLVPNFADVDDLTPRPRSNEFSRAQGLDGTFVVTYAGNMGPAQGLQVILETAARLGPEAGVTFLLVGQGSDSHHIEQEARDRGLRHVRVLPHQPYHLVPLIYAASDLCLVPLSAKAAFDAVPSKVYRIMACERPVLACADAVSDLAELVTTARCGLVAPPDDPVAIEGAIRTVQRDPELGRQMGHAGRAFVQAHYSRRSVSAQYSALLAEALGRG